MVDLDRLRVSLTKNGYLKIADVLKHHPRWEVLEKINGTYPGINLAYSQAANIMGADGAGEVPEFWDEIRSHSDKAIDCFVLAAIIMSHVNLIELLKSSFQGDYKGYLQRGRVGEKVYTNLIFALSECDLCDYVRGAEAVTYDMRGLVYELRDAGDIVRQLLQFKLRKCGWREPERGGTDFYQECEDNGIHRVFGFGDPAQFKRWIRGTLRISPPSRGIPRAPR